MTHQPTDIHTAFGLSYSNYLVLPRTLLQSMPEAWQHQFTALLDQYNDASAHVEYWTSEDDSPFEADAKKRREGAAAAIREQLANVEEELAKTRADLAATHTELDRLRGVIREGVDMAEWHRNEITTWKRKAARLREQLGNAKARISAAATVEVWTNEDGKRFVFADDLMAALDPNPEANPATTAEPADENWRGQQATDCGRGVLGGWCLRPVGHEGDCSPKALPDAEPAAS